MVTPPTQSTSTNQNIFVRQSPDGSNHTMYKVAAGNGAFLSYNAFMYNLINDIQFRNDFIHSMNCAIDENNYAAVFWECAPVSKSTMAQKEFEFILMSASDLVGKSYDSRSFQEYFQNQQQLVVDFESLSRDSRLVVPCPAYSSSNQMQAFAHFASYLTSNEVPVQSKQALLQRIGEVFFETMQATNDPDKLLWISTHGLGVYWLSVRFDSRPKYYQYAPYRV